MSGTGKMPCRFFPISYINGMKHNALMESNMQLMNHFRVTRKEYEKFIEGLKRAGHEIVMEKDTDEAKSFYVRTNGEVNINYSGTQYRDLDTGRWVNLMGIRFPDA